MDTQTTRNSPKTNRIKEIVAVLMINIHSMFTNQFYNCKPICILQFAKILTIFKLIQPTNKIFLSITKPISPITKPILAISNIVFLVFSLLLQVSKIEILINKIIFDVNKDTLSIRETIFAISKPILEIEEMYLSVVKNFLPIGKPFQSIGKNFLPIGESQYSLGKTDLSTVRLIIPTSHYIIPFGNTLLLVRYFILQIRNFDSSFKRSTFCYQNLAK